MLSSMPYKIFYLCKILFQNGRYYSANNICLYLKQKNVIFLVQIDYIVNTNFVHSKGAIYVITQC